MMSVMMIITIGSIPLYMGGNLHARDLRRFWMDSTDNSITSAEILVRRQIVVVFFPPLRAIIMWDRMILLAPEGADRQLLKEVEMRLRMGDDVSGQD